jgi:hypothetical protein
MTGGPIPWGNCLAEIQQSLHLVRDAAAVLMFAIVNLVVLGALVGALLTLQDLGRRLGERDIRRDIRRRRWGQTQVAGATETTVYGLLGLFLAFTFSAAGARFEARRHLVVVEANAISTAWLRIDILPDRTQGHMRDLFRQYTDARLERYRLRNEASRTRYRALQQEIWSTAIAASRESGEIPPFTVLLPALNEMIDITTTRETAVMLHTPAAVFVMVAIFALIGSILAGYGLAGRTKHWVHKVGFAIVLGMALFVIIDLEYPRLGLIRVDAVDSVLDDVRRSMG